MSKAARHTACHYRKGHTMKALLIESAKAGTGRTTVAALLACAAQLEGQRVALVTHNADASAILGVSDGDNLYREVREGFELVNIGNQPTDAAALAALVWLSDDRHDVVVLDLAPNQTPPLHALTAAGFDLTQVTVTRNHYVELRRETREGKDLHNVVVIHDEAAALTVNDVRLVLRPSGHVLAIPVSPTLARTIDAGLLWDRGVNQRGDVHDVIASLAPILEAAPTAQAFSNVTRR